MSHSASNSAVALFLPPAAAKPTESARSLEEEILTLFDSVHNRLIRYAVSFGLSTHDAEDIVQEVFLALLYHLRQRRSRSNLRGWVFRVTHNLALKRRAKNSSENSLVEEINGFEEKYSDFVLNNPEAQLLFDERHMRLLAVFRALPENDQKCLQLRAEGLTYREIAQVVQISLGSVSASLSRSLVRLARVEECA